MKNGEGWDIELSHIAKDRAQYYARHDTEVDKTQDYQKVFNDEFDLTMNDESLATEWASNNMNWSDVHMHAVKVQHIHEDFDYQDGWINGKKEVITKDEK